MQKIVRNYNSNTILTSNKYGNSFLYEQEQSQQKRKIRRMKWLFVLIIAFGYVFAVMGQGNLNNLEVINKSDFEPTIKDAIKLNDLPEIKDSVKRIENFSYGITSTPMYKKYTVLPIDAAKMQNEPLTKLYHSLIKAGMGNYTMPYAEVFLNNVRSKDMAYGLHYYHLSSSAQLKDVGYSGFSDNEAEVFAKKFYKKHTLLGEFNYKRNLVHYYGYDTSKNFINDNDYTKQYYQLFEPKLQLQSHYTDSSKINHKINLSYYNLQDVYNSMENNIRFNTWANMFLNKEKLNLNILVDYYNNKQTQDTSSNTIISLNPYFEAGGERWHADIGLCATTDLQSNVGTARFYFYPQLNVHYNVYDNMIIPYAGLSGNLQKNSFRSLSTVNPFMQSQLGYANTHNKYIAFGGLRGNLSSSTSYDSKVSYTASNSMPFFVTHFDEVTTLDNTFDVHYHEATLLNVFGQVKYQFKEKVNFIAKGNYYSYKVISGTKPYHKPDFDLTFSANYNLQSKLILKGDIYVIGKQWGLVREFENSTTVLKDVQLKGITDINLGAEYRYSKMMSFFVNFNNIGNFRYYRWSKYPTQRFNVMVGLTFVPF